MDRGETLAALRRGDLAGARQIRLPDGLTEFPPELFGLAETLEVLDLGRGSYALPQDLGRFGALRVLFGSGTPFTQLPPPIGDCPQLSQVGFRGCGIDTVPGEALPPNLRWLTLTDNRIRALPREIGERPQLQKLMLSGNRLTALPESLAGAERLELIRFASNGLDRLPPWLMGLPRLAWISYSGNPAEPAPAPVAAAEVPWSALSLGPLLGEGSSGRVYQALWDRPDGAQPIALKLFRGAISSDGAPEREMESCLAAGSHPAVTGALGRLTGHPDKVPGLALRLLPRDWHVLANPPSLASCSRDVYDPALRFAPAAAARLAAAMAAALVHLHGHGLIHGDVYGHNILWDGNAGAAVLGDFGAASLLPEGEGRRGLVGIETLAFGILLGELLERCDAPPPRLREAERVCTNPDPRARPGMDEVAAILA